tara:strand:+ start:219 stop:1046 length:828 start_codon:yes stop_codon:yes gene_type:complete
MKFILIFLLFSFSLKASETITYAIGVENLQYAPHFYVKKENKKLVYKGFGRDIFDLFQEYYNTEEKIIAEKNNRSFLKINFKYKPLPVKRLLTSLLDGRIDFKYPDNKFWGQGKKKEDLKKFARFRYSSPVTPFIDGILAHPNWKSKNKKFKTMATVLGFTPYPYLGDIKNKKVLLQHFPTLTKVISVIAKGKFDGAYVNIQVGLHKQKELLEKGKISKKNALIFNQNLPSDKSNYHLSTLNHHHIIEAFDRFLANKKYEGRINNLRKKHSLDDI